MSVEQDKDINQELRGIEPEIYWEAVRARDERFDGLFVYAVRSTGIYCKPSCPSRRPRRVHVSFFAACAEAEAGGFRACKRCLPREASPPAPSVEMALRVCALIEAREGEPAPLEELGREVGASPHHVQRTFKRVTGITPRQYAAALRLRQFKAKVREGRGVTEALYESGYGSSSRLYERVSERLGMTPARYRRGGKGMSISYTTVGCDMGRLLVAATERGVCSVQFGDDDGELEAALAAEYPAAELSREPSRLDDFVNALLGHLDGRPSRLDLPLDVRATAFQSRVWEELRRIPYGETRSYAEVARSLGRPTATRAVARACATNPVALVTPCHRVVRGDGSPSGFRWGVGRKRALLAREREGARENVDEPAGATPLPGARG
ncbi:MAG TPA: bifunctional DNA-binding transcriptional regulator/O6-methylguanine-DNA methyltransferase Ada [Pyrinomonadaceae bacterium]|jgi:AraC family transcriptional regulator of adaptative response/methylated-DNA-[protein]-cysteine methyltransferase